MGNAGLRKKESTRVRAVESTVRKSKDIYAMATSVDSLSSWSTAGETTKYGLLLFDHSLNVASNES